MADTNEKLDKVIALLELIIVQHGEFEEQLAEVKESVADLGLPGSGYSIFTPEDQ